MSLDPCILNYQARRYICSDCGITFYEDNPFSNQGVNISNLTILNVLKELKEPNATFSSVAKHHHISVTQTQEIFDRFVQISRQPLSKVLCMDEVYTQTSRKNKYSCLILDFLTNRLLDIVYDRKKYSLLNYFERIPKEERNRVEFVIIDMYETYRTVVYRRLPNAKIAVDSFHVIKNFNQAVRNVRIRIMKPLFYNALNCKRENDEYLGKKIPFLNGGLFHPIENYDWKNTNFIIPNDYWINSEETGLLDVFSQYNFTVDESNPTEQEVAIDPEMLGKIFESLLDTDDRSEKGAFYTPREIVHYMCEEALASRLSTILGLDNDAIINYIRYGDALKETEFIKEFASDIDECVSNFTIVDPAVGSGAFLVGMLNQIVKLRTNLLEFTDKKIDKYQLKLEAIQKSFYGVDVEYDAVEIAKLRLWLSLIVDQDTNGNCPNPLPNLNFHLRVGNSLVDKFEGIVLWNPRWKSTKAKEKKIIQPDLFNTDTLDSILHRLKEAKKEYFLTYDEAKKEKLIQSIEREQIELIRTTLVTKGAFDTYDNLSKMLEKKTKPFFVWELEFGEVFENGGFDIAIANPPYVQLQKNGGKLANELQDLGYKTFARTGDIYCIFYEKGVQILKEDGVLCFITSNKWMRAGYGEKTRKFLSENTNPIKLIDFAGTKVFESATVDVNILLAKNQKNTQNTLACIIKDNCTNNLSDYIKQNETEQSFNISSNWTILSAIEQSIKNKVESVGVPLSKWNININYGIKTGYNEAFIIDEDTKNKLISEDPKSAELIRPILRGKDIKRYGYDFANIYLICTFPSKHYDIENYPAIKNYLLSFDKRRLAQTGEKNIDGIKGFNARKKTGNQWFETQDQINYSDEFFKQKIIYPNMTKYLPFFLDQDNFFTNQKCFIITGEHLGFLVAFFNSNIFKFCFRDSFPTLQGGTRELSKVFFEKIPVIKVDDRINKLFETKTLNLQFVDIAF